MSTRLAEPQTGSATVTETVQPETQQEEELVLHLAPPSTSTAEGEAERPKVTWATDTVDNEHMQKKKSKCCCIYKKHKNWQDSSDDDSDSVSTLNRITQVFVLFILRKHS
ncbi:hypothetical protein WR25_22694 isoform B [Diploscapter pachys]|uniref:E3 ubiquitin-protein ligase PPP1R11 n=1 Tax=Diploscapter pachys TaxID=2018661 RepID=A0A2A2M0U0_9BILA|nr:hypothetical protein WR25_22694 isoform B [Diploscapter pachys]